MPEHVRAEVSCAGPDLEALEELADRVAGERSPVPVGEQGRLVIGVATSVVGDVSVEGLESLDRDGHVARVHGLARGGADVEPSLVEIDVAETKVGSGSQGMASSLAAGRRRRQTIRG